MSQENPISKQPLIRHVNRQQMSWRAVDVEHLISEDHPARAIWTLVGRLDLSAFYQAIESSTEEGGRPAIDPQLLISMWVYAYSQGIGSAREVARRCEYDPAFQWLTGLQEVNYHTLADFRVEKQQELDELFTQVLGALSKEGLITLEQVMQDGTKIKALASSRSYLQEETIREHLEKARRRVAQMGDPRNVPFLFSSSSKESSSRFLLFFLSLLWVCGQRVCVVQAKRHIHSFRRSLAPIHAVAPHVHWSLVAQGLVRPPMVVEVHPSTDADPCFAAGPAHTRPCICELLFF